jgi:hypothetical protein
MHQGRVGAASEVLTADDSKFFEAAQALAQSLSAWDLLIIGGSLVMIVSTSYYRPRSRKMRSAYFLFLPAWGFLAFSVYQGIQVQRSYVAYLVAAGKVEKDPKVISDIARNMEVATKSEIWALELALVFLGMWLLIYIGWWVFSEHAGEKGK